jgi:hypothetical protein
MDEGSQGRLASWMQNIWLALYKREYVCCVRVCERARVYDCQLVLAMTLDTSMMHSDRCYCDVIMQHTCTVALLYCSPVENALDKRKETLCTISLRI